MEQHEVIPKLEAEECHIIAALDGLWHLRQHPLPCLPEGTMEALLQLEDLLHIALGRIQTRREEFHG